MLDLRFIQMPIFALLMLFAIPAMGKNLNKGLDAYGQSDYDVAIREFGHLAKQGNAPAQYLLGLMHAKGLGTPRNYKAMMHWYRIARRQGIYF